MAELTQILSSTSCNSCDALFSSLTRLTTTTISITLRSLHRFQFSVERRSCENRKHDDALILIQSSCGVPLTSSPSYIFDVYFPSDVHFISFYPGGALQCKIRRWKNSWRLKIAGISREAKKFALLFTRTNMFVESADDLRQIAEERCWGNVQWTWRNFFMHEEKPVTRVFCFTLAC